MTLFRCEVYLAGQRPTNRGHHLYHSKVDGNLSPDRHAHINTDMSPKANGLTSLLEKFCRVSNDVVNDLKAVVGKPVVQLPVSSDQGTKTAS